MEYKIGDITTRGTIMDISSSLTRPPLYYVTRYPEEYRKRKDGVVHRDGVWIFSWEFNLIKSYNPQGDESYLFGNID